MVGIALAILAGLTFAATGIISFIFLALVGMVISTYLYLGRHSYCSNFFYFLLIFSISGCHYLLFVPGTSSAELNLSGRTLPIHEACIIGRVSSFPEFYSNRSGQSGIWSFEIVVEGIETGCIWKTLKGKVDIRVKGKGDVLPVNYGERAIFRGALKQCIFPRKNELEQSVSSSDEISILNKQNRFSIASWGRSWRDDASVQLEQKMEKMPRQEAVLKALVLGYRKQLPSEMIECFRRTGTLHIFAISGLHVGIIGMLLLIVLKTIGIPRDGFGLCLLPILTIYVISTGMKPSAFRALTMAAVYVLAPLLRSKPDIPSSVAFAAIILLLLNPLEIHSPGFIYSFTVVIFIVMVYSSVPKSLTQGGWLKVYCMGLVITSLAANLASIPLSALLFGTFSPIALLGNLIVVPLAFCIVLAGWLSILIPFFSTIFNHAAVVFINLLLWGVEKLDAIPLSSWQVNPPTTISICLWYGSLIYLFTHATMRRQKVYALCGAGLAVLLTLLG